MPKRKAHQDRAGNRAQSQAWRIEAQHVDRFQRAFVAAVADLYADPVIQRAIARAVRESRTVEIAVQAVDALLDTDRLVSRFEEFYVAVMEETGQAELRREGLDATFEIVAKGVDDLGVPVNPFSIKWIKDRAATAVKQITEAEKKRVRQVLLRSFGRRLTGSDIADQLGATVGLLAREEALVQSQLVIAVETEGLSAAAAKARRKLLAKPLLRARGKRIARTETVQAQNQGKIDSWRAAADQGLVPPGTLKTWVAATESERTCDICGDPPEHPDGLNGQQVPINQPFESNIIGIVDRPPAHPNCRCTMTLSFPEAA